MGVKVWSVNLDRPGMPGWSSLSTAECRRALRLADPLERRRWVVARSTLKRLLGELTGVPATRLAIRADQGGRPSVDGLDFNLSHSGQWALIAVAPEGQRVGVDVERVSAETGFMELAARMYQPEEAERVRTAGAPEFFRLWTAKEAFVKATGVGLAGLRDTEVTQQGSAALVGSRSRAERWPVRWLDVAPGYAAALVTTASTPVPRTG
ncbi:4'-phosphopantetheinyl transferase family protein [Nonomuraea typhae]|uniref:4'-phosphopantetheinyl transferase family protein n=1 Tax=Nonomuraea typhae TaxID=2603600 RepID=UPI0012F90466|nr:4'-phosphopantetheinyl transferase superfamily protein [Nonomuraea typhae]